MLKCQDTTSVPKKEGDLPKQGDIRVVNIPQRMLGDKKLILFRSNSSTNLRWSSIWRFIEIVI